MLLSILVIPLVYMAWVVAQLVRRRFGDVAISLLFFVGTLAAGAWAITQSRASTAGIGFLFLPILASASGALAMAFGASRRSATTVLRSLGIVALVAAAAPSIIELRGGRQTVDRNAQRDADQARRDDSLRRYRARLDTLVASAGSDARDTLEGLLRANPGDRELILAVLDRPQLSEAVLDSFARSPDLGIALHAVQNVGASSATLTHLYRTHPNRTYFFQALAAHEHTPPAILREIHGARPVPITGLDIWLAGNRAAPSDVLLGVARESDSIDAVRQLLQHPSLDCAMIDAVSRGPAVRAHTDDADIAERIVAMRAAHCR